MNALVLASGNAGKVREILAILPPAITLTSLKEVGITEDVPETGATIRENAHQKAQYVFEKLRKEGKNVAVLADDSGLEVIALDGRPGVHSARFAGEQRNDDANNLKLLEELRDCKDRAARFVTVLALYTESGVKFFEGEVSGMIGTTLKGNNGFGYDTLFIPEGSDRTFAEMNPEEKNQISHRALAVRKLREYLSV